MTRKVQRTDAEWQKLLSDKEFEIARKKGTEPAFTGRYWDCHDRGTYRCVACGESLFGSDDKFDSGSGWPSFTRPLSSDAVETSDDMSHGMRRVEAVCRACGSHLGHVFDDGPGPEGARYCINSASLKLERK